MCAYLLLACARHTGAFPSCPHAPCLVHACANVLFAHVCHACCVCIDLNSRIFAYGPLSGRAHAPLSMCVHAHCYCAIHSERWALTSFGDICVPACHCFCGYTLTISPPHTLPYYPLTQHSPCLLSQATTWWGTPPPLDHGRTAAKPTIGARQRRLCLSSYSPLPAPCAAKTSHPASHHHNTLACNHASLPHAPRPHPCTP